MNLVEQLLQVDKNRALKRKKITYESRILKELVGDGMIELTEIDPERMAELNAYMIDGKGNVDFSKTYKNSLLIVAEGVTMPDLKNEALKEHFGATTAADLAKILFRGEAVDIADAIQELCSGKVADENVIKNS